MIKLPLSTIESMTKVQLGDCKLPKDDLTCYYLEQDRKLNKKGSRHANSK